MNSLKKTTFLIFSVAIILLIAFLIVAGSDIKDDKNSIFPLEKEILFIEKPSGMSFSFNVDIADTTEKRRNGLMNKPSMPIDYGMLFIFDEEKIVNMWMKNTIIPLDMIFIGSDKKIKKIAKNTTPGSLKNISSGENVIAVLEINANISDNLNIEVGDSVIHPKI